MLYKRIGRTGLVVSRLCLGTNTFGGGDSPVWSRLGGLRQPDVDRIVGRAVDAGINFLDTADMYADGESEIAVGHAITNLEVQRADIVIATKVGGRMALGVNRLGASRAHIIPAVEASLKRLSTDYVDLLLIHYFDPATPVEETMRTLGELVRQGKVRHIGCSNFAAWQVMKANAVAEREGLERFEAIEFNWSAATRGAERELVPMARDQSIGTLIWGPLVGGLLSGKFGRDGTGAGEGRSGGAVPEVIDAEKLFDVVEAIAAVARELDSTAARVALAWLLAKDSVTSVLFGARDTGQVDDNVGAAALVLSPEQIARIEAAAPPALDYGPWMVRGSSAARNDYV